MGDLEREMQQLDGMAEYARRGLDGERERDKKRQRLLREKTGRERADRSQKDTRNNAGEDRKFKAEANAASVSLM